MDHCEVCNLIIKLLIEFCNWNSVESASDCSFCSKSLTILFKCRTCWSFRSSICRLLDDPASRIRGRLAGRKDWHQVWRDCAPFARSWTPGWMALLIASLSCMPGEFTTHTLSLFLLYIFITISLLPSSLDAESSLKSLTYITVHSSPRKRHYSIISTADYVAKRAAMSGFF